MERDELGGVQHDKEANHRASLAQEEEKKESEDSPITVMPIAINTSRPPSTASVPSGTPAAVATTPRTTTSRRGGRTRSRSPPVVAGRHTSADVLQSTGSSGGGGENPSSAAAAAAAAAKAFSSGNAGARKSWPPEGGGAAKDQKHHHPANYAKQYSGSRQQWPGEEGPDYASYGHSMRRYQGGAGPYGGGSGAGGGEPRSGSFQTDGGSSTAYGDRRYHRGHRYDPDRAARYARGGGHYPPEYRYADQRDPRSHHHHKSSSSQRAAGGTSLVLGGATPIHLPKTGAGSYEGSDARRGSAASVFRGRPEGEPARSSSQQPDVGDEDSPQKILLSLRTPTTSFEEKDKLKKTTGLSLSPTDPPQIQNSHQNRQQDALFEPTKSSEGIGAKPSGSIDMAPSFTLFNQSFDSFGDTNYFNVESTLQNDSFGMARTNSVENDGTTQLLHKNSSVGGASQQLLASASGPLTIGYSPVNSFGNVSASMNSRREPMMYLGGSDARSSSPTQVLNIYRSYSGTGVPRPDMLDDSHMRMSVGSFGGQSITSGKPYGDPSSSMQYYGGGMRTNDNAERGPHFYVLLRKYKLAFKDCTFLLPGIKAALLETPTASSTDNVEQVSDPAKVKSMGSPQAPGSSHSRFGDPSPQDILVARRRVESSVCAFGGSLNQDKSSQTKDSGKDAIFRGKEEADAPQSATVTPSSSIVSPKGSQARQKYEEALAGRYYENESRLSWEFEESPPVEVSGETQNEGRSDKGNADDSAESDFKESKEKGDGDLICKPVGDTDASSKSQGSASPQPKMRYRCKLCGQPKQNHRCPYQQSLARSIGIMVYPAVNAFTAAEPGSIAAPLSEMNNFVDTMKDGVSNEDTPNRPTPERIRRLATGGGAVSTSTQVTPESMRSGKLHSSPPFGSPGRSSTRHRTLGRQGSSKKRPYSQVGGSNDDHDLLFIESMDLLHEQFRVISESRGRDQKEKYSYPALPLPYAQRKKLSDNLFSLSNEVPKLTDECAQVLREAREKDMWDLAVAELMTQVVVVLHCPDGDKRFEGLRQYLLTLGIAC